MIKNENEVKKITIKKMPNSISESPFFLDIKKSSSFLKETNIKK